MGNQSSCISLLFFRADPRAFGPLGVATTLIFYYPYQAYNSPTIV